MRTKLGLILGLSLLANLVLGWRLIKQPKKESAPSGQKEVVVARVIDGDTFVTQEKEKIRLGGIDAPEYPDQCLSLEAKQRLTQLINGQRVVIEPIKKGKFGRTLALVFKDDLLINRILVEEGLGRSEKINSPYWPEIVAAEEEAQKLGRGIWGSACQPPKNCRIKGNYRRDRGTKIYHLPNCYNYQKIVINEKEGDRWFCSQEEAIKAGFVKSKDCPEEK